MDDDSNKIDFISVVIPVYNEEATLDELIKRCLESCEKTNKKFEIILIDDGSSDNSVKMMKKASEDNPGKLISVLLNRNYGQHSAIMAGFSQCEGDLIITLDADLQNPPEEIPRIVEAAEAGNDVIGTRRVNRQDTLFRRVASFIVNKAAQKATGVKMTDYGCMLRGYRKHIVEAMLMCHERSTFIPVLGNSFARNTIQIDVAHSERVAGDSKYSLWKLINLQFNLLTCMTTFPLRVLSIVGGGVSCCGILLGIYILVRRFMLGDAWSAQGVFTLFAISFIFSGFQLVGMGLLGEYIGRIYDDVRARPKYFIQSVNGKKKVEI